VRHPRAPRLGALGEAVYEQYRFRARPGIGVVVHHIEELAVGQLEKWHRSSLMDRIQEIDGIKTKAEKRIDRIHKINKIKPTSNSIHVFFSFDLIL